MTKRKWEPDLFPGERKIFYYCNAMDYVLNFIFIKYICAELMWQIFKKTFVQGRKNMAETPIQWRQFYGKIEMMTSTYCQEQDKEIDRHRSYVPGCCSMETGQNSCICKF